MSQVIVLDTHTWLWHINRDLDRLPMQWDERIASAARVGVSPVSCFEIALAEQRGRLRLRHPVQHWFDAALQPAGIELLPLTPAIATRAVHLTPLHRDPFDRLIIATTLAYDADLASVDALVIQYPELNGRLLR